MFTPIAVIAGDLHLRPTTWAKHPELSGDSYFGLQQVVDAAVKLQVPLILPGDIFDRNRPDSGSVMAFVRQMNRMLHANQPVYCIQGNHDQANPPWFLVHPWVTDLHGNSVSIQEVNFYGLAFTPCEDLEAALGAIPVGTAVLICHQSWGEVQRIGHTDGSLAQMPFGLTVFSGDYHIHGMFCGTAENGDDVWLYSPGSMCLQALNEDPAKLFHVLGLGVAEGRGALAVESHSLRTRQYVTHTAGTAEEFAQVIQAISKLPPLDHLSVSDEALPLQIRKPILRVRYNDLIPDAFDRLVAAADDRFHLFLEPQRVVETMVVDTEATPEGAFDSLLTAVGELTPVDGAVYHGVRRLLEASDSDVEIARQFEEFKETHAQAQPEKDAGELSTDPVVGGSA